MERQHKKASSYIAHSPVLRTVQGALHFTSLADLFNQTQSRLLWEASSHMLQLIHECCSYTYPSLFISSYSFIQLSELEHCRAKKLAQDLNTAAQDSNKGSRGREFEPLPLSHCALQRERRLILSSKNSSTSIGQLKAVHTLLPVRCVHPRKPGIDHPWPVVSVRLGSVRSRSMQLN